jgi:hypothetical protein
VAIPIDIPPFILANFIGAGEASLSEGGFQQNKTIILNRWQKQPCHGDAKFQDNLIISFEEFAREVLHTDPLRHYNFYFLFYHHTNTLICFLAAQKVPQRR